MNGTKASWHHGIKGSAPARSLRTAGALVPPLDATMP
jgi:hypothetical protein